MLLNDGKTDRVVLAQCSGLEALTEYRVLGPKINGCSWIELRPLTRRKHQVYEQLFQFLIYFFFWVRGVVVTCEGVDVGLP